MEPNLNKKLCKNVEHDVSLETGNKRGKKVKTIAGVTSQERKGWEGLYLFCSHNGPSTRLKTHKLVQPLCRTAWKFLKKLQIELSYDLTIPLLGIYLWQNTNSKRYMYPYIHSRTSYNSQDMSWMSIDRWMDKDYAVCVYIYIYIYSGILLGHKKNEIMPFAATWVQLEIIVLSEVGQTEKNKYHYDITYMWYLKKW